ncbi:MAG: hypothetical protein R6U85_10740 [Salinivirgaceae bacterium]
MGIIDINRAPDRLNVKISKAINSAELPGGRGILAYGDDNDYPQLVENAVNSSVTGSSTARILSSAIMGEGFSNKRLNDVVIGRSVGGGEFKVHNLLSFASKQVALFRGYYIHANRSATGMNTEIKPITFPKCRLSKPDDLGYSSKVIVSDEFNKRKIKNFTPYEIYQKNNDRFAESLIDITKNKGQIYFKYFDDTYAYPLSTFDSVLLDLLTENEVSNYRYNESANSFMPRNIVMVPEPETDNEREEIKAKIEGMQGSGGDRTIVLTGDLDDDGKLNSKAAIHVAQIGANIEDTLFESWEKIISNRIRKAAFALPEILIQHDGSTLGTTSGEAIDKAVLFYNAVTRSIREEFYSSIIPMLKNFDNPILSNNEDWTINEMKL